MLFSSGQPQSPIVVTGSNRKILSNRQKLVSKFGNSNTCTG